MIERNYRKFFFSPDFSQPNTTRKICIYISRYKDIKELNKALHKK